ncbi:sentrin-specific protease 1-like [Venturia canescens]|uniref:sentrin-specific protease 1-like n=1 Tax=Venturia canescens TaxID=32260 RepID=UPI001C9CAD46|nr:sentrin-specific protease 1-like [Venturia canescens]
MQSVKTQTAFPTKEKGVQTEWVLHKIEIEESRRPNRDMLLRYISRKWFLIRQENEFSVPEMLSPIREVEDKAEEWKGWGAGEFVWVEDEKENTQNNDSSNIDNKRKRTDDHAEKQVKRIKEEITKQDKENAVNENKRKSTNDNGERQTKRIKIKQEDLENLSGTNWLNDEVINNYLELISNKNTYAMSSFFFPRLQVNGYSAVRRWTKKVNIFEYRKVIIPIHMGNHWCLAVIDIIFGQIRYYDSLGGSQPRYLDTLLEYLKEEVEEKGVKPIRREDWSLETKMNIPRQTNGYDCGIFTCMFARYEARNKEFNFTQRDMPQIRTKMIRELQMRCLEN